MHPTKWYACLINIKMIHINTVCVIHIEMIHIGSYKEEGIVIVDKVAPLGMSMSKMQQAATVAAALD